MWLETSLVALCIVLAAAAGYMFYGWFNRFRSMPVCIVSIGFSICLAVVLTLEFNDLITILAIALQIMSLCMMIATGAAKLRHRLHIPSKAA